MHKSIVNAQGGKLTFEAAVAYYLKAAKDDETLPGTTKLVAKTQNSVHVGQEPEICRQFARGNCQRGGNCRFTHVSPALQDTKRADGKKCSHCGKPGHTVKECYRRIREDKEKEKREAAAHCAQEAEQQAKQDPDEAAAVTVDGYAFATFDIVATNVTSDLTKALASRPSSANTLLVVLDGAATLGVIQDERHCVDIRPCDVHIRVGGKGKPTLVHCTKTGVLKASTKVDGKVIELSVPVRIVVPGFGVDILPECFFLKKKFAVNKLHTKLEVLTPKPYSVPVLRGDALKYDNSWLFYPGVLRGAARRCQQA